MCSAQYKQRFERGQKGWKDPVVRERLVWFCFCFWLPSCVLDVVSRGTEGAQPTCGGTLTPKSQVCWRGSCKQEHPTFKHWVHSLTCSQCWICLRILSVSKTALKMGSSGINTENQEWLPKMRFPDKKAMWTVEDQWLPRARVREGWLGRVKGIINETTVMVDRRHYIPKPIECIINETTAMVDTRHYIPKPMECLLLGVNPKINHGHREGASLAHAMIMSFCSWRTALHTHPSTAARAPWVFLYSSSDCSHQPWKLWTWFTETDSPLAQDSNTASSPSMLRTGYPLPTVCDSPAVSYTGISSWVFSSGTLGKAEHRKLILSSQVSHITEFVLKVTFHPSVQTLAVDLPASCI